MPPGDKRADKRRNVVVAAREVFARDGFARASIDAIAQRAEVSTRTIYNHFPGGKGDLFAAALLDGAEQVADAFVLALGDGEQDVREELMTIGGAFVAQSRTLPEHFALVAQVRADVEHVPRELIERWHDLGPLRVQRVIAARLERLRDRGALRVTDPHRATLHLIALVTAETTVRPPGAKARAAKQEAGAIEAGVDCFLDGYG